MSLGLSPQQPSEQSVGSQQVSSVLSSPAHQPGAHGVKACMQVPRREEHETWLLPGKASAWHLELQGRNYIHRAQLSDFLALLIFILNVVQPTQRGSGEGQQTQECLRIIHPVSYGTDSHVRIPLTVPSLSPEPSASLLIFRRFSMVLQTKHMR